MTASQNLTFTLIYISTISSILACFLLVPQYSFASPTFSRQEVLDPSDDWVDMANIKNPPLSVKSLFQPTDISAVNFFSDGRILNATIWIDDEFQENPPAEFGRVSYGAYIDADFDEKTDPSGIDPRAIDYRVEMMRENGSQSWSRVFEEWSTYGEPRRIETIDNYTGFSKDGDRFVTIYADLAAMGSPDRFRVVFFAETSNGIFKWYADYTNWIFLPTPDFEISTVPESVTLDQGGDDNIAIQLKSTTGSEPTVYLSPLDSSNATELSLSSDLVHMPPFGMATSQLEIKAKSEADPGIHPIFLQAIAKFPSQSPIEGETNPVDSTGSTQKIEEALQEQENQDVTQFLSFLIKINEPVPLIEQIRVFWDEWGNLISFILGSSLFALFKEGLWKFIKPKVMSVKKIIKQ